MHLTIEKVFVDIEYREVQVLQSSNYGPIFWSYNDFWYCQMMVHGLL